MKKLALIVGSALILIGPGTVVWMAYRYIWFTTETIPGERVIVAFLGALFFGVGGMFMIAYSSEQEDNK